MRKVRIDRKKWSRGNINRPSKLLNEDGNMCCLGFAICQITKRRKTTMLNVNLPIGYFSGKSFLTDNDKNYNNPWNNTFADKAANINDDSSIECEKVREGRLIELFKENGIVLEFYN